MNGRMAGGLAAAGVLLGYFWLGAGLIGSTIIGAATFVGLAGFAAWKSVRARRAQLSGTSDPARERSGRVASHDARRSATGAPPRAQPEIAVDLTGLSITKEEFLEALRLGAQKLAALKSAAERVTNPAVRAKAYAVCDSVARILSDIREDPKDLRPARKFLDYYLDATVKVVDRYAALATKRVSSEELADALRRAEESLETIKVAYDRQLAQLLENDVMDLDTELSVLERTIQMEGLGDR